MLTSGGRGVWQTTRRPERAAERMLFDGTHAWNTGTEGTSVPLQRYSTVELVWGYMSSRGNNVAGLRDLRSSGYAALSFPYSCSAKSS